MHEESVMCSDLSLNLLSPLLPQLEMKQRYLVKKMNVQEEQEKDQAVVSMESLGELHSVSQATMDQSTTF